MIRSVAFVLRSSRTVVYNRVVGSVASNVIHNHTLGRFLSSKTSTVFPPTDILPNKSLKETNNRKWFHPSNNKGIFAVIDKTFNGECVDNKRHGAWKFQNEDNSQHFEGEFQFNKLIHGSGVIKDNYGMYKITINDDIITGEQTYFSDGSVWTGSWNKNSEGNGTIVWPNGEQYEGEWKHSTLHGTGTLTHSDGSVLTGEFKNGDIYCGSGTVLLHTMYSSDVCDVYIGSVVKGKYHGQGQLSINKQVQVGEFRDGKLLHGHGTVRIDTTVYNKKYSKNSTNSKNSNNSISGGTNSISGGTNSISGSNNSSNSGTNSNSSNSGTSSISGTGSISGSNSSTSTSSSATSNGSSNITSSTTSGAYSGSEYSGEFKDGVYHGEGKLTHNQHTLQGEFRNGIIYNGSGVWVQNNNKIYAGEWKNGVLYGTLTLPTQQVFKGEFRDSQLYNGTSTLPPGYIVYTKRVDSSVSNGSVGSGSNGSSSGGSNNSNSSGSEGRILPKTHSHGIYSGEVRYGKRHGQGRLVNSSGDVYEGEWAGDVLHGQGKLRTKSGMVYEGSWYSGKFGGSGRLTSANKRDILQGVFKEGLIFEGKGSYIDTHGIHYEGHWVRGVLVGECCVTKRDGSKQRGYYVAGRLM